MIYLLLIKKTMRVLKRSVNNHKVFYNTIKNHGRPLISKWSITRHLFSLHKNCDNREKCEKLNALFPLYKLFPLCTLSQGGIQDEHKTRYKQDANRAMG